LRILEQRGDHLGAARFVLAFFLGIDRKSDGSRLIERRHRLDNLCFTIEKAVTENRATPEAADIFPRCCDFRIPRSRREADDAVIRTTT
jgi:hypothetical protein